MKFKRFKSSASKTGGWKNQHKVTVTRKSGGENEGEIGKVFDKWAKRLLLAFNLLAHAKPYVLDLINYLQQLM